MKIELTQAEVNIIRYALNQLPQNNFLTPESSLEFSDKRVRRASNRLLEEKLAPTRSLTDEEINEVNKSLGM